MPHSISCCWIGRFYGFAVRFVASHRASWVTGHRSSLSLSLGDLLIYRQFLNTKDKPTVAPRERTSTGLGRSAKGLKPVERRTPIGGSSHCQDCQEPFERRGYMCGSPTPVSSINDLLNVSTSPLTGRQANNAAYLEGGIEIM